jgi:hypothetical protein
MIRINAWMNTAKMVQDKTARDVAFVLDVRQPVCEMGATFTVPPSIPIGISVEHPYPTRSFVTAINNRILDTKANCASPIVALDKLPRVTPKATFSSRCVFGYFRAYFAATHAKSIRIWRIENDTTRSLKFHTHPSQVGGSRRLRDVLLPSQVIRLALIGV